MPEAADIRTAIVSVMERIPGIGMVHSYERYADKQSDFKQFYTLRRDGTDTICGWFIRRLSRAESSDSLGRVVVVMGWRIQGYMGLVDSQESELAFDGLIDALVAAFRADETLGGVVDSTIVGSDAGLQIEDTGPVMFAGVLCHAVQGRLMSRHYV